MIEINFKYQKNNNIIKCNEDDIISDVCEQFKNKIKNNKILFIYEDMKINLELKMKVKDLLQYDNKKKKKKYIINVYNEPIQIQFTYLGQDTFLKVNEDEKLEDILKRYIEKINKDFNSVYFLLNGETITEEIYNSTFNNFSNNDINKNSNSVRILVYDADDISSKGTFKSNINSVDNVDKDDDIIIFPNNLRENIIERNIDTQILEKRSFYFYFLIVLIVQYICIVLFCWLGFFLKFNKFFIKDSDATIKEVIPVIIVLIIMAVIAKEILKKYSKNIYLIIYQAFSALFTIYFSYLLSKYIEPKYIIISLSLILSELVAMELYVLIFKNYYILFLALSCSILSFISLNFFSIFWIKELIPIIFISIFWIFSIGYLILHIFIILKICKLDEYFYACIILNYGLFLLVALLLKYIYNFIKSRLYNFDDEVLLQFKIYSFFIIQKIIIISFIYLGFNLKWNYIVIGSWYSFKCFLIPTIIIHFIICLLVTLVIYTIGSVDFKSLFHVDFICLILYIPFTIIFSFLFSYFIEPKFILSLSFILLFNLIAIDLFIFIFNSINFFGYFLPAIITNAITVILFHYLWLENKNAIIANTIIPFVILLIWMLLSFLSIAQELGSEKYTYLIAFNYVIFIIVYALTIALAGLALGIAIGLTVGICYLISNCS